MPGSPVVQHNVSAVFWDPGDVGEDLSRTNPQVVMLGTGVRLNMWTHLREGCGTVLIAFSSLQLGENASVCSQKRQVVWLHLSCGVFSGVLCIVLRPEELLK